MPDNSRFKVVMTRGTAWHGATYRLIDDHTNKVILKTKDPLKAITERNRLNEKELETVEQE